MEITASTTCKYLSKEGRKRKTDLRDRCCDLRMIACAAGDEKVLTALYHLFTYGGKFSIESGDLKAHGELNGFLEGESTTQAERAVCHE